MATALAAGRWWDMVALGRQGVARVWQEVGPGLGQGVGMEMSIMRRIGTVVARCQRWVGSTMVWLRMVVFELVGMFGDAQQRLQGGGRMNKRRNGNDAMR